MLIVFEIMSVNLNGLPDNQYNIKITTLIINNLISIEYNNLHGYHLILDSGEIDFKL
jgi:hypothetical protein